jgi:AcrR family transcriptional regulator
MLEKVDYSKSSDPRVKRTRQWITDAFMTLLQKKTFQAITVQDITQQAGINRATFYAHFNDKYALLDHLTREMFLQMLYAHIGEHAAYSIDNLKQLIIVTCEFLAKFGGNCHPSDTQHEPMIEISIQSQIYEIVFNWLSTEKDAASRQMQAQIMSWTIFGLGVDWRHSSPRQPPDKVAERAIVLLREGVLTTATI